MGVEDIKDTSIKEKALAILNDVEESLSKRKVKPYNRTIDDSKDFLMGMNRLFLHYSALHAGKMFSKKVKTNTILRSLEENTMLKWHTDINTSESLYQELVEDHRSDNVWENIKDCVVESYKSCSGVEDFVEKSLAGISKFINERAERDTEHLNAIAYTPPYLTMRVLGTSLFHWEERNRTWLEVHYGNTFFPESFIDYPDIFKSLLKVVAYEAKYKNIQEISSLSWMNSYSKFTDMFPASYVNGESMELNMFEPYMDLGLWGQYIRRDRTLNKKTANDLLTTGRLTHTMRRNFLKVSDLIS